ncbi:MAG: ABC transporter ATP-binding protein [Oscillospiraceae bacterium]|nr:ABC transporter ATP-binding protein [Oscillospiraceae bacterium]
MIELKDVSAAFQGHSVLEHCSLLVPDGGHTAVMGPSGSGKTTLLRLIAGQLAPDQGSVTVSHGRISYMYQEPRLLPWLTAEENVNLVLSDKPETMGTARQWLAAVGLADAMKKHPAELSGGMRQRVSLARALAYDGDLFLLDEPLSSLDEAMAAELLDLLKQYTQGKSMIFVTHSPEQAKVLGGEIYRMHDKTLERII